ncbi:MAG: 4Fe-4S dicluster domain-containing protein [Marinilabiliaceae bacterium]
MRLYKILKKGRTSLALIVLVLTFVLFIDVYEWIPEDTFNTILFLQFVPSLLNFLVIFSFVTAGGFLLVLLLTLLTGRLYCSVICPLGILQDVVNRISRWRSRKKRFFKFKKPHPVLRYTFLGIMTLAIIFGGGWIVTWLDPYSLAGRTFTYLFKPVFVWGNNNVIAPVLQNMDVYSFYHQTLKQPYTLPVILSLAVIVAIGYFAWKRGRLFCNTICPVGTLLGEVSRFSFLKVRFNQDKCTRCGKCAAVCKSECIDIKNYSVDHTRCVTCFNCLEICPETALSLRPVSTNKSNELLLETAEPSSGKAGAGDHDENRRKLLVTGLALLTGSRIYALKKNKMPENQKDLTRNVREHPVAPPGAGTIKRFNEICTGCSLCVAACPTSVLQPALTEYGISGFMQPHMDYATHFCNFDCKKCGDVCPTGAILPLTMEEKQLTQMGKAIFVEQNCIVYTDETDCGACSEHCPTKAVNMVPYKNGLMIPEVDQTICVGCGACEYPCPVDQPFKAIYVNGNSTQVYAEKPEAGEKEETDHDEDFPF